MPTALLAHDSAYPALRDRKFLRGLGNEVPPLADTRMTGSGYWPGSNWDQMRTQRIVRAVARGRVLGSLKDECAGGDEA